MRTTLLTCCFMLTAISVSAQETNTTLRDTRAARSTPPAAPHMQEADAGTAIFLPGFREYLYEEQREDDESIRRSRALIGEGVARETGTHPSDMHAYLLMRDNVGVSLSRNGSGMTLLKMVGQMLLKEAVQFGYTFAREKVREQSLSEMDYLYLPQGPGVLRTSGEVMRSALQRGDLQAYQIWYDLYQERKNKPPCNESGP